MEKEALKGAVENFFSIACHDGLFIRLEEALAMVSSEGDCYVVDGNVNLIRVIVTASAQDGKHFKFIVEVSIAFDKTYTLNLYKVLRSLNMVEVNKLLLWTRTRKSNLTEGITTEDESGFSDWLSQVVKNHEYPKVDIRSMCAVEMIVCEIVSI